MKRQLELGCFSQEIRYYCPQQTKLALIFQINGKIGGLSYLANNSGADLISKQDRFRFLKPQKSRQTRCSSPKAAPSLSQGRDFEGDLSGNLGVGLREILGRKEDR